MCNKQGIIRNNVADFKKTKIIAFAKGLGDNLMVYGRFICLKNYFGRSIRTGA